MRRKGEGQFSLFWKMRFWLGESCFVCSDIKLRFHSLAKSITVGGDANIFHTYIFGTNNCTNTPFRSSDQQQFHLAFTMSCCWNTLLTSKSCKHFYINSHFVHVSTSIFFLYKQHLWLSLLVGVFLFFPVYRSRS